MFENWTEEKTLAYISGYFDGEGTIFVYVPKVGAKSRGVKFTAALHTGDITVLKAAHDFFGGYYTELKRENTVNVKMVRLAWENKKAYEVLSKLELVSKRPQQELFLEQWQLYEKAPNIEKRAIAESVKLSLQQLKRWNFHHE